MQRAEPTARRPPDSPPVWAAISSASAPIALIGGWTWAAARQTQGFDPWAQSISALAAREADDPWIMTGALVAVGLCHLVSAAGLRAATPGGRTLLALGGAGTLGVAALPLRAGESWAAHGIAASLALGALALWPLVAFRRTPGTPMPLRPRVSIAAGLGLMGLLAWLGAELAGGARLGLAERALAGAEALWPWVVVRGCRREARRSASGSQRACKEQTWDRSS